MDLNLNWLGLGAADFEATLRFYTNVVGIEADMSTSDWAHFVTTGMTLELGAGAESPSPERAWGRGQSVRPSLHFADLRRAITDLRHKEVEVVGSIERTRWGEAIEFIAAEGMRWTLAHTEDTPPEASLHKPHLGWVEMKVHDLAGQRGFYTELMGLAVEEETAEHVVLRQRPNGPRLFLVPGGEPAPSLRVIQGIFQPAPLHMLSFETQNTEQAAAYLKAHGANFLIEVTHREWGGIDCGIADADGNPIQVVQYLPG